MMIITLYNIIYNLISMTNLIVMRKKINLLKEIQNDIKRKIAL